MNEKENSLLKAYRSLWRTKNNEVYRLTKKKINDKFLKDILPSIPELGINIFKIFTTLNKSKKPE